MLWFLLKLLLALLLGYVILWYWLLVGSSSHCPRCGADLDEEYGPPMGVPNIRRRTHCACGYVAD